MLQTANNLIVDGVFRAIDPAFESIVLKSCAGLIGDETLRYVHPAFHEAMARRIELIATGVAVLPSRAKILDSKGGEIDVLLSSTLLQVDGRPASISHCRVLAGPYYDLDTIRTMLETAAELEHDGNFVAAGRLLGEAARLTSPSSPPEIAIQTLERLATVLSLAGHTDIGQRITSDLGDLMLGLGLSLPRRRPLVGNRTPRATGPSGDLLRPPVAPPRHGSGRLLDFRRR